MGMPVSGTNNANMKFLPSPPFLPPLLSPPSGCPGHEGGAGPPAAARPALLPQVNGVP